MNFFIKHRKKEHLQIIKDKNTDSSSKTYFEDIILIPKSLPELNLDEIDTSSTFLGKKLSAPIIISSMTGGTEEAQRINGMLARAAQNFGIAFSVGSQKAMINHPELSYTYEVRKYAPDILLIGNIGIDYLLSAEFNLADLKAALKQIKADALYVHINPLQELAQPEGSRNFTGAAEAIKKLTRNIGLPVLIKEVGDGIDSETAKKLEAEGISAIDISGSGGTSWAAVEGFRGSLVGESFRNWGIPTVISLISVRKKIDLPIISSGGIKSGQDIAKSLILGADMAGLARHLIKAAFNGEKALDTEIEKLITELKITMLLVGAKNIPELKKVKVLLKGELKNLIEQL